MIIRKPVIVGASIICLSVVFSITSMIICGNLVKPTPGPAPVPPDPEPTDLWEIYQKKCVKEGKDPIDVFPDVSDLASLAVLKFKKEPKYFTVGKGHTESKPEIGPVTPVDITNSLIFDGSNAYEESISYGDGFAPKTGNRDYKYGQEKVTRWTGNSNGKYHADYKNTTDYSVSQHVDLAGKDASNPFLYSINKNTVLIGDNTDTDPETKIVYNGSKATHEGEEYKIYLELKCTDFTKPTAIANYAKRINYLSPNTHLKSYNYLQFTMFLDKNFNLKYSVSSEKYVVTQQLPIIGPIDAETVGTFKTKYFLPNKETPIPSIPKNDVDFNYSDYPID